MRKPKTQSTGWCSISVIVDDATVELINVPEHDEDPEQELVFRVTQTTAELVTADFERYRPTLELMAANWRDEKERLLRDQKADDHSQVPTV